MTTSTVSRTGLYALGAAGLLDAVQFVLATAAPADDGPPAFVAVATVVLGVLTLAGVAAAFRGSRAGLVTAIAARVVDTLLLGLPAFFLDAPWYVLVTVSVMAVLTVAGIWWSLPALRRTRTRVA
ncbi:hypothetical protein [Actinoplanes aureus]|uniref:Uncharacterized protein n=1 Tax=Actinoplanes aureus TaxID=2792083 RepID=A0A931C6P6_9ACTN|nr:hypothetical protein [Actinoplanes aureus]MBG0564414.1 hypothetical protein [Actinoplanes aureus]